MPDTPPPPVLSDVIDVGSWARFSPSLAIFIDEQIRCHRLPDGLNIDRGLAVRLVAPAPVITESDLLESEGYGRCGANGPRASHRRKRPESC